MNSAVGLVAPYYEEFGVGVPVIMLHGWPAEHGQMVAMMEPLFAERSGWRRIYVDLPGMGRTPGPEWLTTHDLMLDFVDEFIGAVAGEGCALVGHSYGAQLVRGVDQVRTRYLLTLVPPAKGTVCKADVPPFP
jgi:pimeloyl-ACP methyl ester carboxylesterase